MKKLLSLLMVLMMLFSFAACGGDDASESGADGEAAVKSEVYDAGNVSAAVPEGWKAFAVKDFMGEDSNANDPDTFQIGKDAENDFDLFSKPYIKITYFDKETTVMKVTKDFYENGADLKAIKAGALTWEGFTADSAGNKLAVLFAVDEATGAQFQADVWLKTTAGEISLEDADVLAILGSVKEAK